MKDNVKSSINTSAKPPWADGLKRIYSSVLEEPLPEAFEKLLDQLDKAELHDSEKQV